MARPSGWDILGLDGDPTPGVVESVEALAKQFGDFAHDVESAYRSLNSFGGDTTALQWIGQTADAFKSNFGPLPGRLQKLYTSYSEASDALSAYAPKLLAAQNKADTALRQAQDAHADLQRATTTANSAAADLKTAQQNQSAAPNQQAVTDAQTAHDTAQKNLDAAKGKLDALAAQAKQAHDDRIAAAKECAKALHHAQSDGIHNKHWWEHVGEALSEWGGKIAEIANDLAPFLDVLALATSWIPGVDVITAGLAEADNLIALAGTGMQIAGDAMQGHWGDALMGAGMLGLQFAGGRLLGKLGGEAEGEERSLVNSVEGDAKNEENAIKAEGVSSSCSGGDPVDLVSGEMVATEVDLELPGVLPVILRRTYASGYDTGRLFGPGWSSTLNQRLSINEAGIHFAGDDGQVLHYALPTDGREVMPVRGARWPLVWDQKIDEIRITDPWAGSTWHFPVAHYRDELVQIRDLVAIVDRNGNRIDILRDEAGTPTGLEHPGYQLAIDTTVTDAGPRILGIRLLDGHDEHGSPVKRYRYDDRGRLAEVIDSSGLPYTYEWDALDRITAWVDRVGYRYAYEYGQDGRVVRGVGGEGFLSATFEYRDDERVTILTDSLGHKTSYAYDELGHVTSITDPLGNATTIVSDRYGQVLSRTDALGATTTFERDESGDIHRLVAPDGAATVMEYNSFHQITRLTSPDGAEWHRDYDAAGNLKSVTDPTGATTTFEHSESGALTATTDPLGATTRYSPDAAGLPTSIADPMGLVTRAVRDAAGRPVRVTDPLGAVTTIEWSVEGRPISQTTADGATTCWVHDAEGRLVKAVNPVGAATVFEPGPFNILKARTGPDGVRHTFVYDTERRLRQVVNPNGATWDYMYDAAGRLTDETDFNGRRLGYEYDAVDRLVARVTGTGARIGLSYDLVGKMVARSTPEGDYEYGYDVAGRLSSVVGPDSSLSYERDLLGSVIAESVDGHTTRYTYDAVGRRIGRTTDSGATSEWTFDVSGRPVGLRAGASSLAFVFDAAGRETERLLGVHAYLANDYDAAGRLVGQRLGTGGSGGAAATEPMLSRSWIWRADGVPEEIRDSLRGTRRMTSDASGRVTTVTAHSWSEAYAYDAFGNLANAATSISDLGSAEPTIADRTLIKHLGRTHHDYDAAGRIVRTTRRTLDGRRKTWNYTWDSQDRLIQADTPDQGTWRYTYDPAGRRAAKRRIGPDGTVAEQVVFTWDGPRLAEEHATNADGIVTVLTWDYDPGTFRPAAQRRRTWATDADQESIDEAFHAIVTDLVGTPTELVSPDGRIAWHTNATLWGSAAASSSNGDADCPLRFPGQYKDSETGLHYNLHRYYDPDTASYLSPDPLGLTPAPNDHAYVANPLTHIDPLGLMCPSAAGGAPGAPTPNNPIIADNNLMIAAMKGHQGALGEIQNASDVFITPNQRAEFLDVLDHQGDRLRFLKANNIQTITGEQARNWATTPEFQQAFRAVAGAQGRGDAALVAFAKASGIPAVTMERRLYNYATINAKIPGGVPIRRVML